MLVFTRKLTESFVISEDIVVKVLGYDDHGNVRLGIEAPKSVSVNHDEVSGSSISNPKILTEHTVKSQE